MNNKLSFSLTKISDLKWSNRTKKILILAMTTLTMVACSTSQDEYYILHPAALQKALDKCASFSPPTLHCDQLKKTAILMNQLAMQLRSNPQQYGIKILTLQETITQQAKLLNQKTSHTTLKRQLHHNKQMLRTRLAIVKWLESPAG